MVVAFPLMNFLHILYFWFDSKILFCDKWYSNPLMKHLMKYKVFWKNFKRSIIFKFSWTRLLISIWCYSLESFIFKNAYFTKKIIWYKTSLISYWRRKWQPTPVFLPGKFRGQRSLVGYSPLGCKESDMTEVTEQ